MANVVNIRIDDHTRDIMVALEDKVNLGLAAIGEIAEGYAKDDSPVDTGRLRNSLTYATAAQSSGKGSADSTPKATPEKHTVYFGTNVEYAVFVELLDRLHHTSGKAHFIRDAAVNHPKEFEEAMKRALES